MFLEDQKGLPRMTQSSESTAEGGRATKRGQTQLVFPDSHAGGQLIYLRPYGAFAAAL
jgi:hypothetical protein